MFEDILDIKDCSCKQNHSLTTREYVIAKDGMFSLPDLLKKLNLHKKPLAIYDNNTYKAAYDKFNKVLPNVDTLILQGDDIHADEIQIQAITDALDSHSVLLAVGSGVICDVTRYVAYKQDYPFISVPTAASVDGYVSSSSAMTLNGAKITLQTKAPVGVVCDLEIIAAAPKYLSASGVGDMLSKYISIADWKIGHYITGEYYCPFVADLEIRAVNSIVESAKKIADGDIESIGKLMEGLLLSGIAMQAVGITRPASSFEHHFSHYLETIPVGKNIQTHALHGEKVGIATVAAAKHYYTFATLLKRIYEENIQNAFDIEKVVSYYSNCPQGIIDQVVKENTPTVTSALNVAMLKENFDKVLEAAKEVPSAEKMCETLNTVGGYTHFSDIGMTLDDYKKTMEICCYVRNRFTLLRVMCDYNLFDFNSLTDM